MEFNREETTKEDEEEEENKDEQFPGIESIIFKLARKRKAQGGQSNDAGQAIVFFSQIFVRQLAKGISKFYVGKMRVEVLLGLM